MISKGFYVHYKGGIYFVHGLARNMDVAGDPVVIYDSVQSTEPVPEDVYTHETMRFRTVSDFEELVEPSTGMSSSSGLPRFQRVVGWTREGRPRVKIMGTIVAFSGEYEGP